MSNVKGGEGSLPVPGTSGRQLTTHSFHEQLNGWQLQSSVQLGQRSAPYRRRKHSKSQISFQSRPGKNKSSQRLLWVVVDAVTRRPDSPSREDPGFRAPHPGSQHPGVAVAVPDP